MNSLVYDKPFIIGVGNMDRGDDGAGIVTVRHLRARVSSDILVVEQPRAGVDLISLWQEANGNAVFVVDAMCGGFPAGTIKRFAVANSPPPVQFGAGYSSHSFGLGQALELAAALNCLPGHMVIYGIEGENFSLGVSLSTAVETATWRVAAQILAELEHCR
jgi:hydrogenase maturation protease